MEKTDLAKTLLDKHVKAFESILVHQTLPFVGLTLVMYAHILAV